MGRKVFLPTSPEPEGVAATISRCFNVPHERVTYDGELSNLAGYLFTVQASDADTAAVSSSLKVNLGQMGFTTRIMFVGHEFKVQVFKKHYKYAYAAVALTIFALWHFKDVHKKSFERITEQWASSAWRFVVFHVQNIRIPHVFDEWRNIVSV